LKIDPNSRTATGKLRVTWTNRHDRPAHELVFNFYPHYRVPSSDSTLLAKTVEILRVAPRDSVPEPVTYGDIQQAVLVEATAIGIQQAGAFDRKPEVIGTKYKDDVPTAVVVALPAAVGRGESVTIDLSFEIQLPIKQGRWGQWDGVISLANSVPVLAYYDEKGWQPMPFIPWHQPFFNEAGVYTSRITLPASHKLACTGSQRPAEKIDDSWKRIETAPIVARDFAILCSDRYHEFAETIELSPGQPVTLRCLAFAEHEHYAREIIRVAAAALPVYQRWFGPYPYDQLTFAESFFGWNGNECSGLIMIDERVFAMPKTLGGYVEYLVSHETQHQWWYNVVGTNGYSETFMDEAVVTHFTHRLLNERHGRNNDLVKWPSGLSWLPTIKRENYRNSSVYGAIARGDLGPSVQPIPEYGFVVGLFNGAYDRGSKVIGLIEQRLGPDAFLDFMRTIQKKYAWGMLRVTDFQRELEAYTGKSWDEFFQQWVHGRGLTDWKVESVDITSAGHGSGTAPAQGKQVTVILQQRREIDEPTVLGIALNDPERTDIRIPVIPAAGQMRIEDPPAIIETMPDHKVRVTVSLPSEPKQITIDPDEVLLDAEPANNFWKPRVRWRFTPLFSMLEESDLTTDYDRWNITAGPWFFGSTYSDPWYTRATVAGARLGAYRTQQFAGGVFAGYRTDFRDFIVGGDGLIDHWPFAKTQVGFNIEQRVADPFGAVGPSDSLRAAIFGRYVFTYGSSLYLPPIHYLEGFGTYQDNFLPYSRSTAGIRPEWQTLAGVHYRLDLLTPYWDPDDGFRIDLTYSGGVAELDRSRGTHQVQAEARAARRLPSGLGRLSDTVVAARVYGAAAMPGRGQFFALGGASLFRGFDLAERQGSALWVGNLEWRIPLFNRLRWDAPDNVAGIRGITLATFYDVGDVYVSGKSVGGVAHAVGVGVRLDLAVFSFIERATLRFDVAKTVNSDRPWQFWFGVQQPF
jgi:hypothetical protein